jgi:hypothetical protein
MGKAGSPAARSGTANGRRSTMTAVVTRQLNQHIATAMIASSQTPGAHVRIQRRHPIAKKLELIEAEPQLLGLLFTGLPEGDSKGANDLGHVRRQCR